jgi:hypothetical protein
MNSTHFACLLFKMLQGLMIRMDYELFWPQVMLSCLKYSYKCIEFFVVSGIVQGRFT